MNLVIKVADFGLSVNTGTKEYYRSMNDIGIKLPFRWMAPECLTDYMFSESSDVVYKMYHRISLIPTPSHIFNVAHETSCHIEKHGMAWVGGYHRI